MIVHTAEVLFDGSGRMHRDAAVVTDATGGIVEVGPLASIGSSGADRRAWQVLMPGVVNAHTHLTDAEIDVPIPGGDGLTAWVRRLLAARLARPEPAAATRRGEPRTDNGPMQSISLAAVADVLRRMRDAGTAALGEVSNGTATLGPLRESGMRALFIQEVLAFRRHAAEPALELAIAIERGTEWGGALRPAIGIHAPYSVSPELAVMIRDHNAACGRITSVHLTEDPAERELYVSGSGPWREYLEHVGVWDAAWRPPGIAPLAYYDRLGLLTPDLAAVHLADATAEEIALVAARGVRVILSPASNLHIGNRLPPLRAIVDHGIRFALGTDGRGSNPSVDVFDEARLLAERFAWVDGMLLMDSLTGNGADLLRMPDVGRIAPGMRPGLVAVEIADAGRTPGEVARAVITRPISRRRIV